MSIEKLKAERDAVVKTDHGLHLDCVKRLIAAIDEHVASETKTVKAKASKAADETLNAVGEALGEALDNRQ
jgi:hypothetical protein